tara:strand:- start:176 stop:604 length:429 start_codon:yes stop_codon:yes gene_type:complete
MRKTFRGQMTTGDTQIIRLGTNNGLTGYRIVKFQILSRLPGDDDYENVFQVYSVEPDAAATAVVTFDNPTLLAVAYEKEQANTTSPVSQVVIFDDKIVNQDIWITLAGAASDKSNYYIELEQMKLDLNEATVATLKDMRGRE